MNRRFALRAAVAGVAVLGGGCDSSPTPVRGIAPIVSLSADRAAITTTPATSPTFLVHVARGEGEMTPVSLEVKGLPVGVGAHVIPRVLPTGAGSATVMLTVGPAVTPGPHVFTVDATSHGMHRSATFTLSVVVPEVALSSPVTSLVVQQMGSVSIPFSLSRNGDIDLVGVSIAQLPERVSATLRLLNANETSGVLTLSAAKFTEVRDYTILLKAGASNVRGDTIPIRLTVVPGGPSELMLAPSRTTVNVPRTGADSLFVRLLRSGGFSDSVRLELHGATDIRNAGFDFEIRQPSAHDTVATIVFRSLTNESGVRSILVRAFDVEDNIRAVSNFTVRKE